MPMVAQPEEEAQAGHAKGVPGNGANRCLSVVKPRGARLGAREGLGAWGRQCDGDPPVGGDGVPRTGSSPQILLHGAKLVARVMSLFD